MFLETKYFCEFQFKMLCLQVICGEETTSDQLRGVQVQETTETRRKILNISLPFRFSIRFLTFQRIAVPKSSRNVWWLSVNSDKNIVGWVHRSNHSNFDVDELFLFFNFWWFGIYFSSRLICVRWSLKIKFREFIWKCKWLIKYCVKSSW